MKLALVLSMFVVALGSVSTAGFAGQSPRTPSSSQTKTLVFDYQACMRCKFAKGNTPGKCSNCGAQKSAIRGKPVKACSICWSIMAQDNAKCPKGHKSPTARILTYYCSKDKSSSSQSGNCAVCGKFRSKYFLIP